MKQALLVDDNASQLLMREMVLRRGAIECHAASSPKNALALMRTEVGRLNIGVVITDHLMPAMTGAEFVHQLREFNQEVPVIVISGLPEADTEYEGLNVIFRMKPCEPEELILLVQRALEWDEPRQASA